MEISELNRNIQRLQAEIASVKKQVGRVLTRHATSHKVKVRFQELNASVVLHLSLI